MGINPWEEYRRYLPFRTCVPLRIYFWYILFHISEFNWQISYHSEGTFLEQRKLSYTILISMNVYNQWIWGYSLMDPLYKWVACIYNALEDNESTLFPWDKCHMFNSLDYNRIVPPTSKGIYSKQNCQRIYVVVLLCSSVLKNSTSLSASELSLLVDRVSLELDVCKSLWGKVVL